MLGKSGNLHWYCEVLVKAYGNLTEKEEQKLEKRMDDLLVKK